MYNSPNVLIKQKFGAIKWACVFFFIQYFFLKVFFSIAQ